MSVNLSVKNVPDQLAEKLRRRAEANHRSLQGELMALLEASLQQGPAVSVESVTVSGPAASTPQAEKLSVAELGLLLRQIIPIADSLPKGTSAVEIVRRMRDGRDGNQWQDPDHHRKGY